MCKALTIITIVSVCKCYYSLGMTIRSSCEVQHVPQNGSVSFLSDFEHSLWLLPLLQSTCHFRLSACLAHSSLFLSCTEQSPCADTCFQSVVLLGNSNSPASFLNVSYVPTAICAQTYCAVSVGEHCSALTRCYPDSFLSSRRCTRFPGSRLSTSLHSSCLALFLWDIPANDLLLCCFLRSSRPCFGLGRRVCLLAFLWVFHPSTS